MNVVRIQIDKPLLSQSGYRDWHRHRGPNWVVKAGETIQGRVDVDQPNLRQTITVRWVDSYGRLVQRVKADWNRERGEAKFALSIDDPLTVVNYLECEIGRQVQSERLEFHIRPSTDGWEEYPVFVWGRYPESCANLLREVGIDGTIIYKGADAARVLHQNTRFYAEQLAPEEIALYHRPYTLSWDPVDKPTRPNATSPQGRNWEWLRWRFKKRRAALGAKSMAQDDEGQRILWRAQCFNRPDIRNRMRERLHYNVDLRKAYRPAYYSTGDEPGMGDQTAPFDFCYCHHCMEKFHVWLEAKYGTLTALNAQWGTTFATWDEALPLTTDDTMRLIKRDGEANLATYNLSSWCDHRAFNDDTMCEIYDLQRQWCHEADPFALAGIEGAQLPTTFGGYDYAKLVKAMDIIEHYNYGQNDELIRSLPPHIKKLICFFGAGEGINQRMWYQLIHGDCGQIHYDVNFRFVDPARKALTEAGEITQPTLREIKGGIAKQLSLMERAPEQIGIHYSQPSINVQWMLEALPEGEDWINRNSSNEYDDERKRSKVLRDAWTKVIEDLQLQYGFVGYDDLGTADLSNRGYRAFVLPQSISMTAGECDSLRRFVEGGGVLIADARPALFDGTGNCLGVGQLDDLFGITRKDLKFTETGAAIRILAAAKEVGLEAGRLVLKAAEPGVRVDRKSGARALGKAGQADCLIVRRVGEGAAVYLNAALYPYSQGRYNVDQPVERKTKDLIMAVLRLAGIERAVTVTNRAGRLLPGAEVTCFRSGPVELATVVTNGAVLYGGVGERVKGRQFNYDPKEEATVELPGGRHVYNERTGEYLGAVDTVTVPWKSAEPIILARLPYKVRRLTLKAVVRNGRVEYQARLEADERPGTHAVRIDVHGPGKKWYHYYSKNIVVEGGRATDGFPLALNERKGAYTITARDAVTGLSAEATITV